MAWCENPSCRKDGLRKADIEFCEVARKVLCHGCYVLMHPGWMPPVEEYVDMTSQIPQAVRMEPPQSKLGFAVQITDHDGVRATVSYGGASFSVHAPVAELKRLAGV